MDELFDVFEETAQKPKKKEHNPKKSKKRHANGDVKESNGPPQLDTDMGVEDTTSKPIPLTEHAGTNGEQPDAKRMKRDQETEPVVTDTFETDQTRELAASGGLQPAAQDASALVIHHQVRHQVSLPPNFE